MAQTRNLSSSNEAHQKPRLKLNTCQWNASVQPHLLSSVFMYLWRCDQCSDPGSTPSPLFPDMTLDDVRDYERNMHEKTNIKVVNYHEQQENSTSKPSSLDDIEIHDKASVCPFSLSLSSHFICLVFVNEVSVYIH